MLARWYKFPRSLAALIPPSKVADPERGMYIPSAGIGLAKISLISLSEIVAKCNASPRRRTRVFPAIDGFASAKCC